MRWLLVLVFVVAGGFRSGADGAPQKDQDTAHLLKTQEEGLLKLKNAMKNMINLPDPIHLPFLPTVSMMGLSLSLTKVTISGFSHATIEASVFHPVINVFISMPSLVVTADPYIAGGAINGLPFVGKDSFNATVLPLTIHLSYKKQPHTLFCAERNSTTVNLFINRLFVEFANLNPGSDSGDLINSMISANGPELMFALSAMLNDPQMFNPTVDRIVVGIINKICQGNDDEDGRDHEDNKSHDFENETNEREMQEKIKFVQEFIASAIQESVRHFEKLLGSHNAAKPVV